MFFCERHTSSIVQLHTGYTIIMAKKQIVTFVINKRLDLANHIIALNAYERHVKSGTVSRNQKNDALLKLSLAKRKVTIQKEIGWYYSKKKMFLESLANDINKTWAKIEKDFIKQIEMVHGRPFTFKHIDGVLSSAGRFGYDSGKWFATNMFRNKFEAIDTGMHEMMHFMFHKYYEKTCKASGLGEQQIWDIKESFTVLLNLEFDDLRFDEDFGYPQHRKIREIIKKSWLHHHDFEKALEEAIVSLRQRVFGGCESA